MPGSRRFQDETIGGTIWPNTKPTLAVSERAASESTRKRAIARAVREVAGYLGNTPAVARASYIDPRIIGLYEDGHTIAPALGDLGKDTDFGDLATGAVLKTQC